MNVHRIQATTGNQNQTVKKYKRKERNKTSLDSMSTYSTTSSEEVSESEGVSDEEEESSSEEEGMDADQPTHSRAAIAAAH